MSHVADYDSIPIDFVRGEGTYLIDKKGKKYLDFLAGWCVGTVGWKNKEMEAAICARAKVGTYVPPIFRDPGQEALAKLLVSKAPGKIARAFRCTSGSEAVEFALKCARMVTRKPTVVSIEGVYHGHTMGAAHVGDSGPRMGLKVPGFEKLPMPTNAKEADAVIEQFEAMLKSHKDIAAFMSEPFWTNAGCHIPPEGFYKRIQTLCRNYGVLLIMDEVATGAGRTGSFYGSTLQGLEPDIICLAKSLTGGYATMGATLVTEAVFKKSRGISDYSTFGWLQQDLAASTKNVEMILRDDLPANAANVGRYLLELLQPLKSLQKVKRVDGIGMVFGIEFKLPIAFLMAGLCVRNGLIVAIADSKTLFFSPMLSLTKSQAKEGAEILLKTLGKR
jgi:acetylornithine/succinyldiaminopimelate/putrescine aminotransferase